MDFQKISKSSNLVYLKSPLGTETVQQISEIWVKCKKIIETQQSTQAV